MLIIKLPPECDLYILTTSFCIPIFNQLSCRSTQTYWHIWACSTVFWTFLSLMLHGNQRLSTHQTRSCCGHSYRNARNAQSRLLCSPLFPTRALEHFCSHASEVPTARRAITAFAFPGHGTSEASTIHHLDLFRPAIIPTSFNANRNRRRLIVCR